MSYKIVFSFLFLFVSIKSYADCTSADMNLLSFTPSVVDFTTTPSSTVNFDVSHGAFTGAQTCYFFSFMGYGNGTAFGNRVLQHVSTGETIPYNVHSNATYATNSIIRLASDATLNSHVIYTSPFFTPSPSTVTLTKQYFAQIGTIPPNLTPGLYTDALVFSLAARLAVPLAGDYSLWPIVRTRAVQFTYYVEKELDIAIVSSGGVFDSSATAMLMSFGELESLEARAASIIIKTNVGYRLKASSQNGGELRHNSFTTTIPYSLTVSGSPVNLVGSDVTPVDVSSSASNSPALGFTLPFNVQIGTLTGTEAGGDYTDVISFTIEAF